MAKSKDEEVRAVCADLLGRMDELHAAVAALTAVLMAQAPGNGDAKEATVP